MADGAGNLLSLSAEGFVLAGGQSSRMGADKALVSFAGRPMIETALDILRSAGLPARIAGSRSPLGRFAPEVPDTFANAGPLGGVHAGLAASEAEFCLFLPVDLPLMPPALLACLVNRARLTGAPVTSASVNGRAEPFPVVLTRSTVSAIQILLESGHPGSSPGCQRAWREIASALGSSADRIAVEHLLSSGHLRQSLAIPPHWWFQSANTPADLTRLNLLRSRFSAKRSANRLS
jgi:molybdopterin-guanine dinucleotide biosynthesis protein A